MKFEKLRRRNNNKGFTLIEMVIVITIIGLLTSIAVTKYDKVQENAKLNADYATAANLATAASIAMNDGKVNITTTSLKTDGYIQFEPKSKSNKDKNFDLVTDKGDVTVKIDGKTFYPKE